MVDFSYHAPTEVVFGKNSEQHIAALVKKYGGTKLLLHYGGIPCEMDDIMTLCEEHHIKVIFWIT